MTFVLTQQQAAACIKAVEDKLAAQPCNHTLRYASQWAQALGIRWDDLLDLFEEHGCFCDCEVAYNLPTEAELHLAPRGDEYQPANPWLIPASFDPPAEDVEFTRWLVSDPDIGKNSHAGPGEILVPAPKGVKPRARIRKSVHFFVGLTSGLPSEAGVVTPCPALTAGAFAKRIRDSGPAEVKAFGHREAAFYLARLALVPEGMFAATHFSEVTGVSSRREELRIHRVFIR